MSSCLPFTAIDTELFPANYSSGRWCWLAELDGKMACFSYTCPDTTPEDEALFSNTVWIGPDDAAKVVVMIDGTHGVEGFTGSAIEIDVLRLIAGGQLVLPASTAVLMI